MTTPADIIAETIRCGLSSYMPNHHLNAESIIGQLDAAGYTIVPKAERPSVCPECGSDNPLIAGGRRTDPCPDPWHGGAEWPVRCPTCGSDDPAKRRLGCGDDGFYERPDPWHGGVE